MRRYYDRVKKCYAVCSVYTEHGDYDPVIEVSADEGEWVCQYIDGTWELVSEEEFKTRFILQRSQDMKDG